MAYRLPLTANKDKKRIEELPAGDYLDLSQSGIVSATSIQANNFYGNFVGSATSATFLLDAANIISGTIETARLSGKYDIDISGTADFLATADNILAGIIDSDRLTGTYDIDISGTSVNVSGGTANVSSLVVSGSSNLGSVQISSGIITASSGIVTYYGDGSNLSGVQSPISVSVDTNNFNYYIPYVNSFGPLTGFGATNAFVFNASTGNLGIGTTSPSYKLEIVGNTKITGILTVGNASITLDGNSNNTYIGAGVSIYGDTGEIYLLGEKLQGISSTTSINTSGIITASYFYGDGSNLTNLPGGGGGGGSSQWITTGVGIHTLSNVGIGTTNPQVSLSVVGGSRFGGVFERVSTATTYLSGSSLVLELDCQQATTYTYTIPAATNVGIVSFKNMLTQTGTANAATITVILTQNTAGTGNTTSATGIGTNLTVVGYENGAAVAGISTRSTVGAGATITLSSTGNDTDFISFYVYYNGGTNTSVDSYKVYATKNGYFR